MSVKRTTLYAAILGAGGTVSMILGVLSGGDFLDGMAGAPYENTGIQRTLLFGGLIASVVGIVVTLIGIGIIVIRLFLRRQ